ncbi:MAG: DNA recombination protein RmuC [Vicinamibacteria bacterium]|nr:DNA recombination protein RmuC [Vicinamibacteria bacterium]
MTPTLLAGLALVLALGALAAALLAVAGARRGPADPALGSALEALARGQEQLRHEVQAAREASLRDLGEATRRLHVELGAAQRALSEVKAAEAARAQATERALDSLRRLEAVVAGSASRGVAGEHLLAEALAQLPPDLLVHDVAFGSRVVEYALRLPGGRLLPIDSKWPAAAALQALAETEDPAQRRAHRDTVARELRQRVREVARYVDPERTLSLAVLAVPDAACAAAPEALAEGWGEGVLVVPYSLALAQVLSIYRLALRFGAAAAADELPARLARLDDALRRLDEEVEGRLSRALVQAHNARDALRTHLAEARRETRALAEAGESVEAADARPPARL